MGGALWDSSAGGALWDSSVGGALWDSSVGRALWDSSVGRALWDSEIAQWVEHYGIAQWVKHYGIVDRVQNKLQSWKARSEGCHNSKPKRMLRARNQYASHLCLTFFKMSSSLNQTIRLCW